MRFRFEFTYKIVRYSISAFYFIITYLLFFFLRCPVDDKLISRFRGSWSETGVFETQVFAYMKTFRFTGSPALYIECDVRMCHGRCPVNNITPINIDIDTITDYLNLNLERCYSLGVVKICADSLQNAYLYANGGDGESALE